jgi:hypothetical protein
MSNSCPFTDTIASPGCRPAAAAGEPASTSQNRAPAIGDANQAIAAKMPKARSRFMPTPASRTTSFLGRLATANERGSSESPSSPSSRT